MVNAARLAASFRQPGNTCVFASYAVANNYFTGEPVASSFDAYFSHYGMPQRGLHPPADSNHPTERGDNLPWSLRVLGIHDWSAVPFFASCRQRFSGTFFARHVITQEIESRLRDTDSLYVCGVTGAGSDCHAITLGAVDGGYVLKDTNRSSLNYESTLQAILDRSDNDWRGYRDGVLYTAIIR
ncbi:MAG TPA: hypothetical protein VF595_10485 [Tepidisphaeraceae bacterium]|jgi:hypothetical protein